MTKNIYCVALGTLLLTVSFPTQAQQRGKVYRIGFLRAAPAPEPYLEAFRRGLRELGYTEGQNVSFEYRWANGKADQLPNLAADLVRMKVDLIVTDATVTALPAKKATSTIPIVMASSTVPIESGLIASLAHPAGNVTGLTSLAGELGGKLLELLKEIVPKIARVAIVRPLKSPADDLFVKEIQSPARTLGIQLMVFAVPGPDDYESAFYSAVKERAHALFVRGSPFTSPDQRKRIAEWGRGVVCRQYMRSKSLLRLGVSSPMRRTALRCGAVPRLTSTKFSKAPSPPISPWSSQQSLSSSSI